MNSNYKMNHLFIPIHFKENLFKFIYYSFVLFIIIIIIFHLYYHSIQFYFIKLIFFLNFYNRL